MALMMTVMAVITIMLVTALVVLMAKTEPADMMKPVLLQLGLTSARSFDCVVQEWMLTWLGCAPDRILSQERSVRGQDT